MARQRIAIIGAGAKAVALAAKAHCLREFGIPVQTTIFEKDEVGAAWNGAHGYTDGEQRLCTPAERDLGFPYSAGIDPEIDQMMHAEFSWSAFKVNSTPSGSGFSDWVNRGRKPASHLEFSRYLNWAFDKSSSEFVHGEVKSVVAKNHRWTVTYTEAATGLDFQIRGFNAVVVTGPGPARSRVKSVKSPRVMNGVNFWAQLNQVREVLNQSQQTIAILGGGGTAAAIAAWILKNGGGRHQILFINSQAMLFTRTASFFESRLFDDPQTWQSLAVDDRRAFTTRLNRGVVWEAVTDVLADATNVLLIPGKAKSVTTHPGSSGMRLRVDYENALAKSSLDADLVIDATGFDAWWFKSLFESKLWRGRTTNALEEKMRDDLSFDFKTSPPLHAPMHSQVVGPGFVSLMVLGDMSDRILSPYVSAAL